MDGRIGKGRNGNCSSVHSTPQKQYNIHMREFHLVDFAAHYQKGFRNHVVSITDVPDLVKTFSRYGCYATYFFYSDELLTYMSTRTAGLMPTIAGYEGRVWAPMFPVDLDHQDLNVAVEAARYLLSYFLDRWAVDPDGIQVYFSGAKGFHLLLDTRLFDKTAPSKLLPLLFDSMRRHLALEIPETHRSTVDLAIKDRVRLLRLPNTVHEKSRLYKVVLSTDEVMRLGAEEIRELAREARPLTLTDETGFLSHVTVKENPEACRFFQRIRRQARRISRKPFAYSFRRPPDFTHITFPCAGAQRIWESHVESGFRNNCAIRLASDLRLLGLTEDEAKEKLFEWNERNGIDLPVDELQNVVRSAFQHRFPYRYSCRDEILRRFCPLPKYEACLAHLASHSNESRQTGRESQSV